MCSFCGSDKVESKNRPVYARIGYVYFEYFIIIFLLIHCIIALGKFGPPHLSKATAVAIAALPNPTSACWVFSCFRNPPSSDMDYRIFNVCTWSFSRVRIHTRVGHTINQSAQHFDSENSYNVFLVLLAGFEPRVFGSRVRRSTHWATPSASPALFYGVAQSGYCEYPGIWPTFPFYFVLHSFPKSDLFQFHIPAVSIISGCKWCP